MLATLSIELIKMWAKRALVGVALIAAMAGWYKIENRGARKVVAKVETNNARVNKAADDAGRKSVAGVGGVRNPYQRAD